MNQNNCFECDTPLIGPICPTCNIVTSHGHRAHELRMAALAGLIVGALLITILHRLF